MKLLPFNRKLLTSSTGQFLVELMMAIGLSMLLLPALFSGFEASRGGKAQQSQRAQAVALLREGQEIIRSIRANGWTTFATDGTYHPQISGTQWTLASGSETINGITRQIVVADAQRDANDNIVSSGGTVDPSTKLVTTTVSWTQPQSASVSSSVYLTRYLSNATNTQTTSADFNPGTLSQTQIATASGGEITLAPNARGKWCSPAFSSAAIDLPDGPPVAVAANASATSAAIPNDVFVATAPNDTSSIKLAYVNVTANTATPSPSLRGTFTLDSTQYSSSTYVPTGTNITNSFKTNDVKYYKSTGGKVYALMATDMPDHEVIAVQINNGSGDAYQDPVNKIYKYWTYFNTKIYGTAFSSPTADAAETSNAGDNNGFQTNATNAYINDGSFAVDTNSGNGTGTNCDGTDKDKHRFYNYGFSIPSGATINGLEVNLNAKTDSTTGSPKMCVELSWDGGTTWTTAKTATLTTSSASYTLGGSSDTWGRTWSNTNFSDTNFRVRIIDVASSTSRDFSLDYVGAKIYYNGTSTTANDQAPFGYGASALTILGNTGYVDSGGYLYTFDLSNIDSKSPTNQLDQIGCRILLDGYDCEPNNGTDMKYAAGETGANWSDQTSPAHLSCSDGGNIEINADHQLSAVQVGSNKYVYVAVGAGTNPELDIADVSTAPSNVNSNTCGRGSDTGWKKLSSLDFDPASSTEEAANSVYAKDDGTRAYMSSNGGIIHSSIPDSDQFYIIDTSDKANPKFLSTWPSTVNGQHYVNTAETGYYNGNSTNIEMYPRRALTVLNGQRAVIVGQDGVSDSIEPQEYQVLNLSNESTPTYCGGLNFLQGFNDLTSVSEADGDNFVYMVANTNEKQLKIIEGGPDSGQYYSSGSFVSPPVDLGVQVAYNRFVATVNQPANTTLQVQVAVATPTGSQTCANTTYSYVGPDGTSSTFFTPSGTSLSAKIPLSTSGGYQNPGRCFSYKVYLSTNDVTQTPTFYDETVNYSP